MKAECKTCGRRNSKHCDRWDCPRLRGWLHVFALLLLVAAPLSAAAEELPGEGDVYLAIRAAVVASTQLDRAIAKFGPAIEQFKAEAAKKAALAAYWEDACESTLGCGSHITTPTPPKKD